MDSFSAALLDLLQEHAARTISWCVLPNHYHALVEAPNILKLLHELGRFHGKTSHAWNGEENTRGRQVFHRSVERFMRSERHFFATINYVHNNPVHHGYVRLWTEWPWSSAVEHLEQMGPGWKPSGFGKNIRSAITERSGTMPGYKLAISPQGVPALAGLGLDLDEMEEMLK